MRSFRTRLQQLSILLSGVAVAIGILVLIGWIANIESFETVIPGFITMKANTAICFISAALCLWALLDVFPRRFQTPVVVLSVAIIVLFAGGTGLEYISGRQFGIDELFFRDYIQSPYPGRMAQISAFNFMLVALGLVNLGISERYVLRFQITAVVVGFSAYFAITGYILGVPLLYGSIQYTSMAIHTGVGFLLLSWSMLCARPRDGLMTVITSDGAGGILARFYLPMAILGPLLLGLLLVIPRMNFGNIRFGIAMLVLSCNLLFVFVTWMLATRIDRTQQALRESEERWETTLRSIGDAVIATDATGKVTFMNEVAEKLTGWPLIEAQGKELNEIFNIVNEVTRVKPENPVAKVIRLGQVVGLANHTALICRNGKEFPIEDSGAPIRDKAGQITGVVMVFHDTSEKRTAEKVVRDSERLATTGRLASSLAHEIHNPLDTIGNLLYLIDQSPDVPQTVRQYIAVASEELTRVTQMTQHMLAFQREAKKPVPFKIGEVLHNVIALYERKIASAAIEIEKQVEFEGEFVGLPGEMRQVLANLLGNAIEAIGKNGKIRLRAYAGRDWRQGRRGLRLTVADNGPGIPPEIRDKIFDPFFTTKGENGTGLGLWITLGIIRTNDGILRLRTVARDGRSGTCFSVFFPFSTQETERPPLDSESLPSWRS